MNDLLDNEIINSRVLLHNKEFLQNMYNFTLNWNYLSYFFQI